MAAIMFETTMAERITQALGQIFTTVETISAKDAHNAIVACDYLQNLFHSARSSIDEVLREGVSATEFASRYEPLVKTLDDIRDLVRTILVTVKSSRLPELGQVLISKYESLDAILERFHRFVGGVIAAVKNPIRSIDWQHVREVEAAYASGETKPFREIAVAGKGS